MKIYFAVQCHNFQHRLCWQLSSIIQQNINPVDVIIDIASLPENGNPSTEFIIDTFRKLGMKINHSLYSLKQKEKFAKRGFVRNDQVAKAIKEKCDFIFYADCDNVYHPEFFAQLYIRLNQLKRPHTGVISSTNKPHTQVDITNKVVTDAVNINPLVHQAYIRADHIPTIRKHNKPIAGGGMQICGIQEIVSMNHGKYLYGKKNNDKNLFTQGQRARSDIQFRGSLGGSFIIETPPQIHLNHRRDKELGYHTEEQR
jgi:hypothetical protein